MFLPEKLGQNVIMGKGRNEENENEKLNVERTVRYHRYKQMADGRSAASTISTGLQTKMKFISVAQFSTVVAREQSEMTWPK